MQRLMTFKAGNFSHSLYPSSHRLQPQSRPLPDPLSREMASVVHPGSQAYPPPPTFSRTTTESSTNGIQHSHSTMNSFDAPQSSATTPTPTPPASRHQTHAPYMSSFNGMNGNHVAAPRPFQEPKLSAPQKYYASAQKSEIYTVMLPASRRCCYTC